MFTVKAKAAAVEIFQDADYDGALQVLPDQHSREVCFILDQADLLAVPSSL